VMWLASARFASAFTACRCARRPLIELVRYVQGAALQAGLATEPLQERCCRQAAGGGEVGGGERVRGHRTCMSASAASNMSSCGRSLDFAIKPSG
jgi:hypothetical protein